MKHRTFSKSLFCITLLLCLSYQVFASEPNRGLYYFKSTLPKGSNWVQALDAPDSQGYAKMFIPAQSSSMYPENAQYQYTIGDQTPLLQAMQAITVKDSNLPCKINETRILESTPHMILYTVLLDQCTNGTALSQIVKSFLMSDGTYTIGYSADPHKVAPEEIKAMNSVIKSVTMALR